MFDKENFAPEKKNMKRRFLLITLDVIYVYKMFNYGKYKSGEINYKLSDFQKFLGDIYYYPQLY